jgi:hypothetical protein
LALNFGCVCDSPLFDRFFGRMCTHGFLVRESIH